MWPQTKLVLEMNKPNQFFLKLTSLNNTFNLFECGYKCVGTNVPVGPGTNVPTHLYPHSNK